MERKGKGMKMHLKDQFIQLEDRYGKKTFMRADHIIAFYWSEEFQYSRVLLLNGHALSVINTPDEIWTKISDKFSNEGGL